jgi:putative GTP pyrophosphokinase
MGVVQGLEMDTNNASVDSWEEVILIYNSAMKEMVTRLEILSEEFQHTHSYNPIEHLKSRLKSPESIVKKLRRHGYESSIENMVTYVKDIAGVRVICSFTSDVYKIAEAISAQSDIEILSVKDYIKNPKRSGYKSYHMIVTIPIFLSDRAVETKVEIQIRTIAMDFWASLEHKIYYKFEGNAPEYISKDLRECSAIVSMLDAKMLSLNEAILQAKKEQDGREPELELKERRPEAIGPSDNIIRALSTVAAKGETLKA